MHEEKVTGFAARGRFFSLEDLFSALLNKQLSTSNVGIGLYTDLTDDELNAYFNPRDGFVKNKTLFCCSKKFVSKSHAYLMQVIWIKPLLLQLRLCKWTGKPVGALHRRYNKALVMQTMHLLQWARWKARIKLR